MRTTIIPWCRSAAAARVRARGPAAAAALLRRPRRPPPRPRPRGSGRPRRRRPRRSPAPTSTATSAPAPQRAPQPPPPADYKPSKFKKRDCYFRPARKTFHVVDSERFYKKRNSVFFFKNQIEILRGSEIIRTNFTVFGCLTRYLD